MSEGPIAQERRGHTVPRISIPDSKRVCSRKPATSESECGRRRAVFGDAQAPANCPDCIAALRADAAAPQSDSLKES